MKLPLIDRGLTFSRRARAFLHARPRANLMPSGAVPFSDVPCGEVLSAYWRDTRSVINFGDYITEVLFQRFGYRYYSVHRAKAEGRLDEFDRMVYGGCSMIDDYWLSKPGPPIHLWGTGYWGAPIDPSTLARVTFHAVRGPLTRDLLGLSPEIPLGDPSVLLPLFFPRTDHAPRSGRFYVPHFFARFPSRAELRRIGVDSALDTRVTKRTWWELLRRLESAEFILTDSLHAAIVAHSYGTPWALCSRPHQLLDKPIKWQDWFAYLDIEGTPAVTTLSEGLSWWNETGSRARIPDVGPLLAACPLQIRDEYAKRRIDEYLRNGAG